MGGEPTIEADEALRMVPSAPELRFEEWYRSEHHRLVAVLRRLGASQDQASDVAAEAFSRALERWERVSTMASPSGWTFRVALNLLRRNARRARLEHIFVRSQRDEGATLPQNDVWDAVAQLPLRQRTAVVLFYLFDLPYDETSRVMGVSKGTVAATLSAARHQLAVVLGEPIEEALGG